jgi:hypothetical protein
MAVPGRLTDNFCLYQSDAAPTIPGNVLNEIYSSPNTNEAVGSFLQNFLLND